MCSSSHSDLIMDMEYSNLKKFLGIQFKNGTNDVVPKRWLHQRSTNRLYWPPTNQEHLAQQREAPQDNWKIYTVSILCHGSKWLNYAY